MTCEVTCPECKTRHDASAVQYEGISEDFQGRDLMAFKCAACGKSVEAYPVGGADDLPTEYPDEPVWEEEHHVTPRPGVLSFAEFMEEQLQANDHKGGWANESEERLVDRLLAKVAQLSSAIHDGRPLTVLSADVANYAMMIADIEQGYMAEKDEAPYDDRKGYRPGRDR